MQEVFALLRVKAFGFVLFFLRTVVYARVNHVGFGKTDALLRQSSFAIEGAYWSLALRVCHRRAFTKLLSFFVEVQPRLSHPEVHAHAGLIPELLRRSSPPGKLPAPDNSHIFTIQTASPGVTVRQRLSSAPLTSTRCPPDCEQAVRRARHREQIESCKKK